MTAAIGRRAWRAVRRTASAIRRAHDEQVYMWECDQSALVPHQVTFAQSRAELRSDCKLRAWLSVCEQRGLICRDGRDGFSRSTSSASLMARPITRAG